LETVPAPSRYISSCIVMIVLTGGLYWLLRRNDWL
jgi:Mg2+ and Co2+ transporter CorA